jgi:adenylylsulfate kinase
MAKINLPIFWFTGLSGSGKTTMAIAFQAHLKIMNVKSYILDGDVIRRGLSSDLGYQLEDGTENCRRVAYICNMLLENDILPIVSLMSPVRKDRDTARKIIQGKFVEVYVDCDVIECERRDVKGLYKKVRNGEIKEFVGISSPYDIPLTPEIHLYTNKSTLTECIEILMEYWEKLC